MGRKKSKRTKIRKPPLRKLETRFDCLKCHHEKVVECKINKNGKFGQAICRICEANFKCSVTPLDNPVDIYYRWIDTINE